MYFRYMGEGSMSPDQILDRNEACQSLHISRQTLLSWIRKGKLKVWKRVGKGSNAALLFDRKDIETLMRRDVGAPGISSTVTQTLA
jgi:excisionase family DNA binding protein